MNEPRYEPPPDWTRIRTIEAHTGGEPLRVIVSGFPVLRGDTILAQRRDARENHDALRKALMWEPRGHADMYGALPVAAVTDDGDIGVLFLHNEGWSTMCGHGIIALVKVGLECGLFEPRDPTDIRIDTPAGRVVAAARIVDGRVRSVSFRNVPSFLVSADACVRVPGVAVGSDDVRFDLAFGGAFYAYVEATSVGLDLTPDNAGAIIAKGRAIQAAIAREHACVHPTGEPDLNFLYGVIFLAPVTAWPGAEPVDERNVCVFAEGELDRSPTGTGVSGRVAALHAKGRLPLGRTLRVASVLGSVFAVRCLESVAIGQRFGVVPEVTGSAFLTGTSEFWLDPEDALGAGFLVR